MGPLLLGQFTTLFDSQRAGVATVLIFFVIGAVLLLFVNEKEGVALAKRPVDFVSGDR
jgi:UMF1 family MFS transporter